ncbi:hypothetical protein F5X98DRAFT_343657 [Xylaria grammica]|nr:hypothetical protein F5X98DRAFT_343657 [Xylaria grammica]
MTKVIKVVLQKANVVVCTPFAASTMSTLIQPLLLWIDEVFRVSEADTMMVLSLFPSIKFKFLSGDPKQLGIEVLSANMRSPRFQLSSS